jgi:ABC-2 type transport system ATP-binding protein
LIYHDRDQHTRSPVRLREDSAVSATQNGSGRKIPPAIEVRQLRKTYPGGVEAVKGIDFDVAPGEVFGLLGPNGAGKSTTIGILTTTVAPTSGHARLASFDVGSEPLAARRVSAVVFQESVVDRSLTGRRNLEIHARLWGVPSAVARDRITEVMTAFGLTDLSERPVVSYSGGQRRRLEIARALMSRPRILFLDEPTVGLDPRIRYELLDLIAGLRTASEMTILLTTHYLDEAERLCDRVAIVHAGRIVALDTPGALLARLGDQILELRVEDDPGAALRLLRAEGVADEDAFAIGSTLTVPLRNRQAGDAISKMERSVAIGAVTTRAPTLDDVYLQLTGESLSGGGLGGENLAV